jgi:hypothetical protein
MYKISSKIASLVTQNLATKLIRWWHAIRQQNWRHGLVSEIDLLKHKFINELIHFNTTRQRTDSLKHKLDNKLVRCNINSSTNWFAKTQNYQQTDSLGHHNLVAKLFHSWYYYSVKQLIRYRQHNSAMKTNSLQTSQFGNEHWFTSDNTIWQRTLVHC